MKTKSCYTPWWDNHNWGSLRQEWACANSESFSHTIETFKQGLKFGEKCVNPEFAGIKIPKVGDKIYVENQFYIDHGEDDVLGGLATVSEVKAGISAGRPAIFVSVKEHPGHSYNWKILAEKQEELAKRFGQQQAKPDPDFWISFPSDNDDSV